MSSNFHRSPEWFAMEELHHQFNKNIGPYTWVGYEWKSANLIADLQENEEFELITIFTDTNNQNSCIFVNKNSKAMILFCSNAVDHAELEENGHVGAVQVSITASPFSAMEEIVALLFKPVKDIEEWLKNHDNK